PRAAGRAQTLNAAIAEHIVADDSEADGIGRARRAPVHVAGVQTNAVRPLEGVVLKDEVVAVIGRDEATLRIGEAVPGITEGDALHANVRLIRLRRRED